MEFFRVLQTGRKKGRLPPAAPEPEETVLPEVVPEAASAEAAEDSAEPPPDSMNMRAAEIKEFEKVLQEADVRDEDPQYVIFSQQVIALGDAAHVLALSSTMRALKRARQDIIE